jgi:tRNA(fMet)-specific endonuclease VapC
MSLRANFPSVRRRLTRPPMAEIAISTVTQGELAYGVTRKLEAIRLREVVDESLLRVAILPWDSDAAREYGALRAVLEEQGQPMGQLDMMIGAHALAAGLTLVTNDRAFGRIEKLKIQDWTKS